jgi:hypothetical protein
MPIRVIPETARIGDNVNITCDRRSPGIPIYRGQSRTLLYINGATAARDRYIELSNLDPNISTFIYPNVMREDHWIGFSCYFDEGSPGVFNTETWHVYLNVLCKL